MHDSLVHLLPGPVVTDGAWGTQLQLAGLGPHEASDAWNLSHPSEVEQVGRAYVEAGSQVILTNTLGANRIQLAHRALDDQVEAINRAGVELSKRAAAGRAQVFASLGPTGKILRLGQASVDDLLEVFGEQARALAAAGADALLLETFTDVEELVVGIRAAKQTGLPVVASLVFDSGKHHDRTMMGETPEAAVQALLAAGADVVGANCGRGIDGYIDVCRRMHAACDAPLWLKPNAGLPEIVDGRIRYRTTPEQFASRTLDLVAAGASFVGGCCGTNPAFLRAVVAAVTALPSPGETT